MNILRRAVVTALAGSAMAMASTHASADAITYSGSTVTTAVAPGASSWSFNTLPTTGLFGWTHTSTWKTLEVTTPGDVWVTLSQTAAGQRHGSFSLWSTGDGKTFAQTVAGHQHRYNEVRGPNDTSNVGTNVSNWLGSPGDGEVSNNVDHIVGYGNTGTTFTNTNGDFVGYGQVFDGTQSFNAANPHLAAAGSFARTFSTAHGDGTGIIEYTQLFLKGLQAGHYAFVIGGSCATNTSCGAGGNQNLILSATNPIVSAVPVPAAVWLLSSALAGMGIIGRRKDLA